MVQDVSYILGYPAIPVTCSDALRHTYQVSLHVAIYCFTHSEILPHKIDRSTRGVQSSNNRLATVLYRVLLNVTIDASNPFLSLFLSLSLYYKELAHSGRVHLAKAKHRLILFESIYFVDDD